MLDEGSSFPLWCLVSAVPGAVQIVPRAELCAVIILCRLVHDGAHLHVYIDNKAVAYGISNRRSKGDNEDLWLCLWEPVEEGESQITTEWV